MSRAVLIAIVGFAVAFAAVLLTLSLDSEGEMAHFVHPGSMSPSQAVSALPSIDVVRIDEKGDTVLAGSASAKAELSLLDGEREIGRAIADDHGEWVVVPNVPFPAGVRNLVVEATDATGTTRRSVAPVILVVPDGAAQPPLALTTQADGAARLMLGPVLTPGELAVTLADHDGKGHLAVTGQAVAGTLVQLYLDNRFIGRVAADGRGKWRLAIAMMPATGALRADQVDDKGKVHARVEVPLQVPSNVGGTALLLAGASWWVIGRPSAEKGAAYSIIYAADPGYRRDIDRFYPGQVTQIPRN